MADEIHFDNGGSAEVIKSTLRPGSLAITLYDFNEDGSNSHVTATPAEWDAFVAAGDRALGRPSPALPVTVTSECNGNTFSIQVRGMAEPAPVATPLEERLLGAIEAADEHVETGWSLGVEDADFNAARGRAEGLRAALAMVREAGPTVPRAAVAAALAPVFVLHAQVAEECGEERVNAIELLLTALDEARSTLESAGLWRVATGSDKEQR